MTETKREALSPKLQRVLGAIPLGQDHAISLSELAERAGCSKTTARDRVQTLREREIAPIASGRSLDGYWIIQNEEELELFKQAKKDNIEKEQQTRDHVQAAYNSPQVTYGIPDGGQPQAAADLPQEVADAVKMLVAREGVEAAEDELKARAMAPEDNDRAKAALSYLRQQHPAEVSR